MNKKIIYIAGKVTGEHPVTVMWKFQYNCYKLGKESDADGILIYDWVVSPVHLDGIYIGIPHEEAMKICLEALSKCTHAFFLKDWKDSKGAQIEHQYCKENGIEIIYEQ